MRTRCGRRVVVPVLTAALLSGAAGVGAAHPAAADPLSAAKAQAASLQSQVAALQTQAEQATEKYDATEAALGELVGQQRLAQERVAAARAVVETDRTTVNERARALYMSGGTVALYAHVLSGTDPGQLMSGLHEVQALSNTDERALVAIDAAAAAAAEAPKEVDALLQRQNDLMAQAAAAFAQVEDALARQQEALADATAQVATIEAQIQAQIDAENAARAAAMLATARQAAFSSGMVSGPASAVAQAAIAAASTQLGKPYVYGGSGPDVWDCSGLTQWAYRQAGVELPRTAAQQYAAIATKVPLGALQPGDLLFWATDPADPATIHHVAIYLGGAQMLAAPHTGTVVQIQPVYLDGYFGAARPG
jgi:peptidoglycan DL-endopeptidase CwlO